MMNSFVIGVLLIMALYHFALYLQRREDQISLFFGFYCTVICLRMIVTNQYLNELSPTPSESRFLILKMIDYITVYLAVPIFFSFLSRLFRENFSKWYVNFVWYSSSVFVVLALTCSATLYSTLHTFYLFVVLSGCVTISYSLTRAFIQKRYCANIALYGWLIFLVAILNDVFVALAIYSNIFLLPYGLTLFIFSQSLIISKFFARAYRDLETTTKQKVTLEELDREKTHFFQNVSHELRTPLTLIMNPIEEAYNKYKDDIHEMALKNSKRLYRLVNQLLDFQKISSGKKELKLVQINLTQFMNSISKYFKSIRNDREVSIDLEITDSADVHILGEIDALEKIVFNYISNAIKYSEAGGKIRMELRKIDGENVRISVHDTGMGISKADQSKLFKLFSQVDGSTSREFEGTGLGLALVKDLAEKMNGRVGVKSILKMGSTFYVEFPILEKSKVEAKTDLLIVDDEPEISEIVEKCCSKAGFSKIKVASNAKQARKLLEDNKFKCVISDLVMPGEDGISLLTHVNEVQPNAKKVLITGKGSTKDIAKAANDVKVDKIIIKPLVANDLESTVKSLIDIYDSQNSIKSTDTVFDFDEYKPKEWHLTENLDSSSAENEESEDNVEGSGELILVVDDLKDMRTLISKSLLKRNFRVITAVDGVDGLVKAKEHKPDIIVTDWMMPRKSGIELIADLKEDEKLAHIPTILLTAKSDDESRTISTKIGSTAYIGKPFDELELLSTVENLINLKKGEIEIKKLNRELSENVLKRFLPPAVVDSIVEGSSTINDEYEFQNVTVMFTDICSFSKISNDVGPKMMADILNTYLDEMTRIIFKFGGTIDKIMGDALMVIWGAPKELSQEEQVHKAYECSIELNKKLSELNAVWQANNQKTVKHRIGIHNGPAVVGFFGGNKRTDYTAIGNTINKARRIESSANPGETFISATVRDMLPAGVKWEHVGSFEFRGVSGSEMLFRIMA
jgi:signal transduction histidine kinase/class 3 adenylate cyclase